MIRKALLEEIPILLQITRECAKKMIDNGIYQWNEHYPNAEAFKKDVQRGELYVLVKQEEIIGCIAISSLKDEEYNIIKWLTSDKNNIYIHRLAIHPKYQHQGLAKQLMDFAEQKAGEMNASSVRLDTFSQTHC